MRGCAVSLPLGCAKSCMCLYFSSLTCFESFGSFERLTEYQFEPHGCATRLQAVETLVACSEEEWHE